MDLRGKTVWLIGASEGIGAALAKQLAEAGAFVALSARSQDKLQKLAEQIPNARPIVLPLDVCDKASIASAWAQLIQHWPMLDMVIYNVGTYEPLDAAHYDLAKIETMVDTNLHGALRMLAHVVPYFRGRDAGTIALVGSVAGYRGLPGALGYGLSKAAIIHLAEDLKIDLAKTNVDVRLINPGFVKTRLTAKNDFPMPFMISPEAAASAIVKGLRGNAFEIHFPKRFSLILKLLRLLPYSLYFKAVH